MAGLMEIAVNNTATGFAAYCSSALGAPITARADHAGWPATFATLQRGGLAGAGVTRVVVPGGGR
jgi:hypothetical protein